MQSSIRSSRELPDVLSDANPLEWMPIPNNDKSISNDDGELQM
jgi:hypothetical protein